MRENKTIFAKRFMWLSLLSFLFLQIVMINSAYAERESFTRLRDTPQSYKDQAGKCVTVKDNETGLQFEDCGTGGGAPTDAHYLTDQAEDDLSAEVVVSTIGKAVATSTKDLAGRNCVCFPFLDFGFDSSLKAC